MIFDGREHEYNKSNIPLAKALKKKHDTVGTKTVVWFSRYYPVRFQKQKAIGNYIADFYCAKTKLVIVLDGGGHDTLQQKEKDNLRTKESNL